MTSAVAAELRAVVGALTRDLGSGATLWRELVAGGLAAVAVPEAAGGSGGTVADLCVVVGELGRAGTSCPVIEANTGWLLLGSTAVDLPVVAFDATLRDGVLRARVPWARQATLILAHVAGTGWLAVEPARAEIAEHQNVAGEPRDLVATRAYEPVAGPDLRARVDLLWAAAVTGAAGTALRLTRDHVATREQFGRPLLAIPAVAALLARMRADVLQAETALRYAVDTAQRDGDTAQRDGDGADAATAAAVARVVTARTATEVARLAHQLHGAIGITAEHGLGRYTTRLLAWRDTATTERDAARRLGAAVRAGGETALWQRLTG